VRLGAHITKKRVLVGVAAVIVVLGILSFVLPHVGGGGSGITRLWH
jgi:hypothetical protein